MPSPSARWIKEQICFLLVLAVMVAGFGYLLFAEGHWRRSTAVMGGAMLLAAGLRLVVPEQRVGLLQVRGRWADITLYAVLGVLVLAIDLRLHR